MNYHAIIVDDGYAADALKSLLHGIFPEISVNCSTYSIYEAISALKKYQPEIVFLNMAFTGIFEFIFSPEFALQKRIIIFTINDDGKHQTNLLANGLDFLAKPFSADAVSAGLQKAVRHYGLLQTDSEAAGIYHQSLLNLRAQVEKHSLTEKITIPVRFGYQIVMLSELVYLQADEDYTILYFTDANVVVSNLDIDGFRQIIPEAYFVQINTFTIINLHFLKKRSGPAGKNLLMIDGTMLTVSKSRLVAFDKMVSRQKGNPDLL
jgi:two-component system LytT family response regulator